MQHPFDNFLRACILLGDSDDDILAACTTYRLFFAVQPKEHLADLREQVMAVSPAIARTLSWDGTGTPPRKPTKAAIQKVITDARMVTQPDSDIVREVLALRYRKHIATAIEVLLLVGTSLVDIQTVLEKNYYYPATAEVLTSYGFYFWSSDMLPHAYGIYLSEVAELADMYAHWEALTDTDAALSRLNLKPRFSPEQEMALTLQQGFGHARMLMRDPSGSTSLHAQGWLRSISPLMQVYLSQEGAGDADEVEEQFRFLLEEDETQDLLNLDDIDADIAEAFQGTSAEGAMDQDN